MKYDISKIIKESLISLATLGIIGGSINGNVANAKYGRYHRCNLGYFHNGR